MRREDCPCPKTDCERRKECDPCRAYHGKKGKLPYCERPRIEKGGLLARLSGRRRKSA